METTPFYTTKKDEKYSRPFTIHGILSESARQPIIGDINQSVEKSLLERHKIALKYPDILCVKVIPNDDDFVSGIFKIPPL